MEYSNPYIENCLESSSSLFRGLRLKEKELINMHHSFVVCKKGDIVIKEGEKSKGLICPVSGKIKVFRKGVGGRGQIISMVKPFGIIGYQALFYEGRNFFTATALEDTVICLLEKNTLVKILKSNADLSLKLMRSITDELVFANNRIISLTQKHIMGRIAESLLLLRDTYGLEADGKTLKAALSREDIANLSSMITSNAIRTLSELASEGIIKMKGRKITINDPEALQRISEAG